MNKRPVLTYPLLVTCLAGIVLSFVSLYEHVNYKLGHEEGAILCTLASGFDCKAVSASPFSEILGLPLGAYGMGFYAFLFCLVVLMLRTKDESFLLELRSAFFYLASLNVAYSLFLFYVAKTVVGALCFTCSLLYIVSFLCVALIFLARDQNPIKTFSLGLSTAPSILIRFLRFQPEPGVSSFQFLPALFFFVLLSSLALPSLLRSQIEAKAVPGQPVKTINVAEKIAAIEQRYAEQGIIDDTKGPAEAPVEILEYFDYECPACRVFNEITEELMSDYPGKIRVRFRHFPLDNSCNASVPRQFHRSACVLAELSRCASEQSAFADMHELIMVTEEVEDPELGADEIREIILARAESRGLDRTALKECLKSDRALAKIRADVQSGQDLGLKGTPSVWVNGEAIPGLTRSKLRQVVAEKIQLASKE